MENFPVEIIGEILSGVRVARDVVVASTTSKKWQEAFRINLHTLSFNSDDWPIDHLTAVQAEGLITQTILRTTGLRDISIMMDFNDEFSATAVIEWLMHTRETLRELVFDVETTPITELDPSLHGFPCLETLSLSHVCISILNLNALLSACPKIKILKLIHPKTTPLAHDPPTLVIRSPTLTHVNVQSVILDKFTLEAENIKLLHFEDCRFDVLEFVGKGTLKNFTIDHCRFPSIDINETFEKLQSVEINNSSIIMPQFYEMMLMSCSSNLPEVTKLMLWDFSGTILDLEQIIVCSPQLRDLSLKFMLNTMVESFVQGSSSHSQLEGVIFLQLGWNGLSDRFVEWIEWMLKRCPKLEKLIIYGDVFSANTLEARRMVISFVNSIMQLTSSLSLMGLVET